jgi:hypothetical protein
MLLYRSTSTGPVPCVSTRRRLSPDVARLDRPTGSVTPTSAVETRTSSNPVGQQPPQPCGRHAVPP